MAGESLLEREGLLLPEEHRGKVELESSTPSWLVLVLGLWMVGSCVLMVVGRGQTATWVGSASSVMALVAFAWAANRGIDRQNRKIDELEGSG